MKAAVYHAYGSPDVLSVQDVETPAPKDNEVLINIRAAVVEPTDIAMRLGKPFIARFFSGLTRPKNPILGFELAGDIEAVGKDVTRFKPGDRVFGVTGPESGSHAPYMCLPEDGTLTTIPEGMEYEEAVSIVDGAMTALPFLKEKGHIQPGQQVLINGASGSVGGYGVQLAKHFGANVTGVCGPTNIELVKSLGADKVIDYSKDDFTANGERWDIVFDAVGKSSFSRCRSVLKPGGYYLTTVPSVGILFFMPWTAIFGNKKALMAATGLRPTEVRQKDLAVIKELMELGKIRPVIDRRYSLEDIADAHRYVEAGHKKGSVIITMEHDEA